MITHDPEEYKKNLDRQVSEIKLMMDWSIEIHIRRRFDNAIVDSAAQACIDYAKQLGLTELVNEMQAELAREIRLEGIL